jgi:hypothetical protein
MSFSLIIFSNLSSDFFEFHPPLFTTLNIYNYIIIIHPEEEEEEEDEGGLPCRHNYYYFLIPT